MFGWIVVIHILYLRILQMVQMNRITYIILLMGEGNLPLTFNVLPCY
jgi:hypothetical protein